jgi:hypothetical protein
MDIWTGRPRNVYLYRFTPHAESICPAIATQHCRTGGAPSGWLIIPSRPCFVAFHQQLYPWSEVCCSAVVEALGCNPEGRSAGSAPDQIVGFYEFT